MQGIASAPLVHQLDGLLVVPPGCYTELMGGYDSSDVFSANFFQPHSILSLPNEEAFFQADQDVDVEPIVQPKYLSGATYSLLLGAAPLEVEEYLVECTLNVAFPQHIFDQDNPEISSMLQVAEIWILLGLAKGEMKVAYLHTIKTDQQVQATVDADATETSRSQQIDIISVKAAVVGQQFIHEKHSADPGEDNKVMVKTKLHGGTVLLFDNC